MALVGRRKLGGEGDLLAAVGGIDVELGVVYAYALVWIEGCEGYLHGGGEGVRGWYGGAGGGEVEGVDGGVLENEAWLGWTKDDPYEEDHEEYEEDESEDSGEYLAVELVVIVVVMMGAFLLRHDALLKD
ncbi:uncharacterized protein DS421_8g238750 [Arachis hypogaea]|nr:uncharacterized protein DS421_18g607930 [Arachis hypogaea]QHO31105.1 uncharacterized protein DS421_8g238750 [Arachis hypogaea]